MLPFIIGMNSALSAVAGLSFLRFWLTTKDRLFLLFATAFLILAADWAVLAILPYFSAHPSEHNTLIYSVRLLAFILILAAIIDKNDETNSGQSIRSRSTSKTPANQASPFERSWPLCAAPSLGTVAGAS